VSCHDEATFNALAVLAVDALPPAEAAAARAHLDQCETCRTEYRELAAAAGVFAVAAIESAPLSDERAAALKNRVLAAAVEQRPPRAVGIEGFLSSAVRDDLIEFAPGIGWAVVVGAGMTLVYWVLDPPACGSFPQESHPQVQAGLVLEGAMLMHFADGSRHLVRRGDTYAIRPGTLHAASFEEHTVLFETYAPNYTLYEDQYRAMRAG
jgi:mannose-6-phosphate isomerase-like protein (cupin superfamily)